jgi:TIR domain
MTSQYPHGHTYDLFVSYSTEDLDWVRVFHDDLIKDVNRFTKPNLFPFLDKARLQPGCLWDEKLLAAAGDSAIFVPIMSPRFFESDYCQKELNAFIEAHGFASGASYGSRILPVKLLCSAPADHVLHKAQAVSFCIERDDAIPYDHQPGTMEYRDALRKLAFEIARVLKTVPPKRQWRPAVYLAPDFKPASEKLRASLQHHFDVLPENPMELPGLSPEEFQRSLEQDFARCFVSIHPLNDAPFAKPVVERQLDFARTQSTPRLVWTADRPDELTNAGFEWFTSQAEIEDRVRRLYDKPPETKSTTTERLIYFLCPDRANKTQAEPLLEVLERRGVHVYPSPLDGPADQAMKTHVSALDELDGCLIYYGNVDRDWFDAVFLRVQKKIRQRGLLSGIFLAPPRTPHKTQDLRSVGVPLLEEAEAAVNLFLGAASGATA